MQWKLYMDGLSNENEYDPGLMFLNPKNHWNNRALRFSFKASNNEAEYEALLARLRLTKELQVDSISISCD